MKIEYKFVDGTVTEIEVDGSFGEFMLEMKNEGDRVERKETRRHVLLSAVDPEDRYFDSGRDTLEEIARKDELERLTAVIGRLQPQQRELLHRIYWNGEKQKDILKGILGTAGGTSKPAEAWYRVRKSWADASSQKGAFKSLDNAKKCADENPGYSVFDESGKPLKCVGWLSVRPLPMCSGMMRVVAMMESSLHNKTACIRRPLVSFIHRFYIG